MAIDQRTSAEQRAVLRDRYAAEPVPPTCPVCGKAMGEYSPVALPPMPGVYHWQCGDAHSTIKTTTGHYHDPDVLAAVDDADSLAAALREAASLRDRLELAKTPCRCDPPGSGEEYCTGHCELNAEIKRLRKIISDTMSAGNDALTGHMSSSYAVQVMRGMLREEATKVAEEGEE